MENNVSNNGQKAFENSSVDKYAQCIFTAATVVDGYGLREAEAGLLGGQREETWRWRLLRAADRGHEERQDQGLLIC